MKHVGLYIFFFFCQSLSAQVSLGVRNGHAMVYVDHNKSILLFGGADEKSVLDETWLIKNSSHRKLSTPAPPARTFASMVYDTDSHDVILFGGNSVLFGHDDEIPRLFNDTWVYRNESWKKIDPATSPEARTEASMAYDPERKCIVLFGGIYFDSDRKIVRLGDTWEFNGSDWTKVSTGGPTPRSGTALVYSYPLKKIILLGGPISLKNDPRYNGPLWTWDGKTWEKLAGEPDLVYNPSVAYHSKENYFMVFGGWDGKSRLNRSLKCTDGNCETIKVRGPVPPGRNHAGLVFDSSNNVFVLYGGHDGSNVFGDLWTFKKRKWKLICGPQAVQRVENGH